jgi:hypothetical protein
MNLQLLAQQEHWQEWGYLWVVQNLGLASPVITPAGVEPPQPHQLWIREVCSYLVPEVARPGTLYPSVLVIVMVDDAAAVGEALLLQYNVPDHPCVSPKLLVDLHAYFWWKPCDQEALALWIGRQVKVGQVGELITLACRLCNISFDTVGYPQITHVVVQKDC